LADGCAAAAEDGAARCALEQAARAELPRSSLIEARKPSVDSGALRCMDADVRKRTTAESFNSWLRERLR
jgi:hypothetical protein